MKMCRKGDADLDMDFQQEIPHKELGLSTSIRFEDIFGEEYRKHMFFDVHPLRFCARYVNTCELDTPHAHPYIQIWYVKSGSFSLFYKDSKLVLGKGALVIIPPNFTHYIDSRGDSVLVRCEVSADFFMGTDNQKAHDDLLTLIYLESDLIVKNLVDPHCCFSDEDAVELEEILDGLCNEFEKMDSFSGFFVRSNLVRLLAVIGRAYNVREHNHKVLNYREGLSSAIKYINENFGKKLYLKDVCQKAMMDRTTFAYLFKMLIRVPFSQYVQYVRVLHAQKLLAETDKTQMDIAISCGFHSVSFLHKTFKQYVGFLPGEYRRNMQKLKQR